MINEPVEGGLGEGAADLLAQMGGAGAFGSDDAASEGEGMMQPVVVLHVPTAVSQVVPLSRGRLC